MIAANAIKSKRIIEQTNGEAGIERADDKEAMFLLDWIFDGNFELLNVTTKQILKQIN